MIDYKPFTTTVAASDEEAEELLAIPGAHELMPENLLGILAVFAQDETVRDLASEILWAYGVIEETDNYVLELSTTVESQGGEVEALLDFLSLEADFENLNAQLDKSERKVRKLKKKIRQLKAQA